MKYILRFSLLVVALLVISVIGLLGLAHSSDFATKTLLPFIAEKSGVPITAGFINLDSFSKIETKDLKVEETEGISFNSKSLDLTFNLMSLLSKKIDIEKLQIEDPKINIMPLDKAKEQNNKKPENEKKVDNPFSISLQDIKINNASISLGKKSINNIEGLKFSLSAEIDKKLKTNLLINELSFLKANFDGTSLADLKLKLDAKTYENAELKTLLGTLSISEIQLGEMSGPFGVNSNFDMDFNKDIVSIKNLLIDGTVSQERFINLVTKGKITKDLSSKESTLSIRSEQLALSPILKLFNIEIPVPKAEKATQKPPKEETKETPPSTKEPKIELPETLAKLWLTADIDLNDISFEDILVKSAKANLKAKQSNFSIEDLLLVNNDSNLKAAAQINLSSATPSFKINADTNLIKVADLNQKLSIDKGRKLAGEIKDLSLSISGDGLSESAIQENAKIDFSTKLEDIDFDQNLKSIIPFNLIFLPFDTLAKINELNPLGPLPGPVMGPLKGIIEVLEDLTKLHCDKGEVKVKKENDNIVLETATFNMGGLVPDLKLPGTIGITSGKIKINSKLKLFKTWIPMPLKGTASLPYPDIPVFVKELTKALLGTPGDMVGGLAGEKKV